MRAISAFLNILGGENAESATKSAPAPHWRQVRSRGQCETRSGASASLSTPALGHCSFWQRLVLFLTSQDSACARNSRAPQPLRLVSPRSDKSARTSSACIHYVAIHEGPLTPYPPPCVPQARIWLQIPRFHIINVQKRENRPHIRAFKDLKGNHIVLQVTCFSDGSSTEMTFR